MPELAKYEFGIKWKLARMQRMCEMSSYTTKTFLTLVVNNILGGVDRLALGRLAVPVDFARYSICSNAGARISALSVAIMGPIFGQGSRAVGAGGNKNAEIYEEAFEFVFGWLVLISIWICIWKRPA